MMKLRLITILFSAALLVAGCGSDVSSEQQLDTGGFDDAAYQPDTDVGGADAGEVDTGPSLPERPWSVEQSGHYGIGFSEREVIYDAEGTDEPRELRLAVWYPTLDETGPPAKYADLLRRREALADASVALDAPAPLLVFSHGNGSMAEQSYFMTEFFASHGWVVVAPDHTGNTFRDTNGSIDLTSAVFRSQDVTAVLDAMLALPADDPLAGLISAEDIVLSGHSFGGFTTLASSGGQFAVDELVAECEQEPSSMCEIFDGQDEWLDLFRRGFYDARIAVAIPQTPGGYQAFRDGLAAIEVPTLLFTGGMDRTLPNEEEGDPIWQAMSDGEHMRIDVTRAGHFTFSNMCDVFGGFDQVRNDGCNDEFIPPEDAYELVNAYSLAFARYHLYGDESAIDLLSGERLPYDGIEISRKAQ